MAAAKKPKAAAKPSVSSETYELAVAKYESSGLTLEDANELGLTMHDPASTTQLATNFQPLPCVRLPYFDPWTGEAQKAHPVWPDFFRIRYLKIPMGFGGKKAVSKYTQPGGKSNLCAYFPRIGGVDWPAVLADPREILTITEGEFKSAKATKEGFPTIGLGGVHSFGAKMMGLDLLPELEKINWVKREVHIVYDSDFRTNANICRALNALAEVLERRGAIPHMVMLPDISEDEETKTGIDDYLVAEGADAYTTLQDAAEPLTAAKVLWRMNQKVTYVHNPGAIVVNEDNRLLSPSAFKDHAFSTEIYLERKVSKEGSIDRNPISAADAWIRWPLRAEVGKLTYRPGRERLIEGQTTMSSELNTWPGWGCEPKKGDARPFLDLVDHLFTGAERGAKEWFLRWCAYPLQYPGVKMFSAVVIHGRVQGTGKSSIGYTLGKIYGKNFKEIKQEDLRGSFNTWAKNKQFVMGDEITGSDNRRDADTLKNMISRQTIDINEKHVSAYEIPDCINYLFTTNQPDSFFLEDRDRRFFIHEVTVEPLSEEFYVEYNMWLAQGGAAVFDYLMNLDLGDFNPAAPAMRTRAKERMTEDVRSDIGSWVVAALEDPDQMLKMQGMPVTLDLITNQQLLLMYDPDRKTRTTANGLGRELRRHGAEYVCDGIPIKTKNAPQSRYYIFRNHARWKKATISEVKAYLDQPEPAAKIPKRAKY